jgi:hypothetical protein
LSSIVFRFDATFLVEPALALVLLLVGLKLVTRRDPRIWAIVPLLAVFAPMSSGYATRALDTFVRYLIIGVPLVVLAAGLALAPLNAPILEKRRSVMAQIWHGRQGHVVLSGAVVLSLAAALPSSVMAMTNTMLNDGSEAMAVATIVKDPFAGDGGTIDRFASERDIAGYLDGLRLGTGAVLIDDFLGYPIVLSSNRPRQFLLTSDRDFKQALADPAGSGVKFALIPDPKPRGLGSLDAINRTYNGIYQSPGSLCEWTRLFASPNQGVDWMLCAIKIQG